jgi:hypothetical protein
MNNNLQNNHFPLLLMIFYVAEMNHAKPHRI